MHPASVARWREACSKTSIRPRNDESCRHSAPTTLRASIQQRLVSAPVDGECNRRGAPISVRETTLVPPNMPLLFLVRIAYGSAMQSSATATSRRAANATAWRFESAVALILLSATLVLAFNYFLVVEGPNYRRRFELHNMILQAKAGSPYVYRVLVPYVGENLYQFLRGFTSRRDAFQYAYFTYDVSAIFGTLWLLYRWCRVWFRPTEALVGALMVAATMPIALRDHFYQPWSLIEPALFAGFLLAVNSHKDRYLVPLVLIATLNRATGLFLPLAFFFARRPWRRTDRKRQILLCAVLFGVWAATMAGLRWMQGGELHVSAISHLLERNLRHNDLIKTAIRVPLFLGAGWWLAARGVAHAPPMLRRVMLIVPFYTALVVVWGVWYEVRLLMTLYPVLVPIALSWVFGGGALSRSPSADPVVESTTDELPSSERGAKAAPVSS